MAQLSNQVLNRIAKMDVPGVGNVLTILGFDKDAEERTRAKIDKNYSDFQRVSGDNNQERDLSRNQEKVLDTVRNSAILSSAAAIGVRDLQDRFNYERIPALQAVSQSSGRFTEVISQALIQQEEYVKDITSVLNTGITASAIAGRGALGVIGSISNAKRTYDAAKDVARAKRVLMTVRALSNASKLTGAGLAVGLAVDAAVIVFANRFLEDAVRFARRERIQQMFNNAVASAVLNIEPAAEYYRQTRAIQNFTYEDFQTLQNQTEMYAVGIEQMYSALQLAEFSIPDVPNVNSYAAQIANLSNFFGVGQDRIGSIFANLAPIGAPSGQSRTIQPVVNAFEKFFVAVSQSVNPSLSQLELVNQMSEFSRNYVFGKKMVTDLSALAQIQDFVSRTAVGGRQTTQPTQAVIRSLDSVLLDYASFSNANATVFAQEAGISRADAVRGVTGDASVFSNILESLKTRFKITGEITDEQYGNLMYYLTSPGRGLNLDTQSAVTLTGLVESYSLGNRISRVQVQNALNMTDPSGNNISGVSIGNNFNGDGVISFAERRYFDRTASTLNVVSGVVSDTFSLFNETMSRVPEIVEMTRLSNASLADKFVDIIGKFADFVVEVKNLLSVVPVERLYDTPDSPEVSNPAGYVGDLQQREERRQRQEALGTYTGIDSRTVYGSQAFLGTTPDVLIPNVRNRAEHNIMRAIYRENAAVTGVFNEIYNLPDREPYRHKGIDADLRHRAPIYSPVKGVVVEVGYQAGYGNFVRVKDVLGGVHTFAHLSSVFVSENQEVDFNTKLGEQGSTGFSVGDSEDDGSHLHYDVRLGFTEDNSNPGGRIDPVVYYEALEEYELQTGEDILINQGYNQDAVQFSVDINIEDENIDPMAFAEKFVEIYNNVYAQSVIRE